jgi:hypothetical protein
MTIFFEIWKSAQTDDSEEMAFEENRRSFFIIWKKISTETPIGFNGLPNIF